MKYADDTTLLENIEDLQTVPNRIEQASKDMECGLKWRRMRSTSGNCLNQQTYVNGDTLQSAQILRMAGLTVRL